MKTQITIQGEVSTHKVDVTYKTHEAWYMENPDPDNNYIEILEVSGDLPSNFNDFKEDYEAEIIEQI